MAEFAMWNKYEDFILYDLTDVVQSLSCLSLVAYIETSMVVSSLNICLKALDADSSLSWPSPPRSITIRL